MPAHARELERNRRRSLTVNQKYNFSPSWISRDACAAVIVPKFDAPNVLPIPENKGVLVRLNTSARNSRCFPSMIGICFSREKSRLRIPGIRAMPVPELPKVFGAWRTKEAVLNHSLGLAALPRLGFEIRLGRGPDDPVLEVSGVSIIVSGMPV